MARGLLLLSVFLLVACGGSGDPGSDSSGAELAGEVGCLACHADASNDLAPTLYGIWGTEVDLADGRTVTVDEAYVRKSITEPAADVVMGYGPTMPVFPLENEEVDQLVEWVRSLG